jgi:hypothetical protein
VRDALEKSLKSKLRITEILKEGYHEKLIESRKKNEELFELCNARIESMSETHHKFPARQREELKAVKNKLNAYKSLVSRMKNDQRRRSDNLEFYSYYQSERDQRYYLSFKPRDSVYQMITFESDTTNLSDLLKSFEKITGLKVRDKVHEAVSHE